MEILVRFLIALLLVAGGLALAWLYQHWLKQRTPAHLADLGPRRPGTFTLVYFTTPGCVPCKTVQRPAIKKLEAQLGSGLEVIEIDAGQQPDLAARWGVLSVPTTFVIDPQGKVRHINHGVTRAEQLLMQIQG